MKGIKQREYTVAAIQVESVAEKRLKLLAKPVRRCWKARAKWVTIQNYKYHRAAQTFVCFNMNTKNLPEVCYYTLESQELLEAINIL